MRNSNNPSPSWKGLQQCCFMRNFESMLQQCKQIGKTSSFCSPGKNVAPLTLKVEFVQLAPGCFKLIQHSSGDVKVCQLENIPCFIQITHTLKGDNSNLFSKAQGIKAGRSASVSAEAFREDKIAKKSKLFHNSMGK